MLCDNMLRRLFAAAGGNNASTRVARAPDMNLRRRGQSACSFSVEKLPQREAEEPASASVERQMSRVGPVTFAGLFGVARHAGTRALGTSTIVSPGRSDRIVTGARSSHQRVIASNLAARRVAYSVSLCGRSGFVFRRSAQSASRSCCPSLPASVRTHKRATRPHRWDEGAGGEHCPLDLRSVLPNARVSVPFVEHDTGRAPKQDNRRTAAAVGMTRTAYPRRPTC